MAIEALAWPDPPTLTDGDDDTVYNMGTQFHVLEAVLCSGVQWEVPDTVQDPPGGHVAALWNADTATRLAFVNFTPVPNTLQSIPFAPGDEVALAPGVNYLVSILTEHYSFRAATIPWLVESPSLNLRADSSKLSTTSDPTTFPGGTFAAWYYISPLAEEPAGAPGPAPDGVAVPVALGTPGVELGLAPAPDGVPVPVALGTPAVGMAAAVVPDGVAIPVALGTPGVGVILSPNGLPIPVTLGTPAVGAAAAAVPDGIAIPVALGTPGVGATVPVTYLPLMVGTATVTGLLSGTATIQ